MYSFKLPDIGEGVSEGEIVKWHVKAGDSIRKDQDMVEVMTDKVTVKIPSPVEGTVGTLYFEEGAIVEVGKVLLDIKVEGEPESVPEEEPAPTEVESAPEAVEEVPEAAREQEPEKPPLEEEPEEVPEGVVLASPAVRRIARERGIRLSDIPGTGPNGRVTLEDLEGEVPAVPEAPEEPTRPEETPAEESVEEAAEEVKVTEPEITPVTPKAPEPAEVSENEEVLVPRGLRRLIFEKMTKSKQIIPHFTIFEEINVGPMRENMEKLKRDGITVSFTPFFVKAAALALKDFPYLNATYDEDNRRYIIKKYYNIGVAIDTPDGLTVAVVKGVGHKSLVRISSEISDLAKRARENDLKLEEVQDSTFTVTNVGSIAGIMSTPIINYPEVAILGVHRTLMETGKNGEEKEKMYITLSCDHRLVDGAVAARFVKRLKGLLEEPILILSQ